MWLSDISVRRPLVAVVISALLTVFGLVAFSKLTVREMPDVQTPSVSITTTYEGAAPEVMESQVTKPIEDQLSGISGIKNINSVTRWRAPRMCVTPSPGPDPSCRTRRTSPW